jgi:hypothetical protein
MGTKNLFHRDAGLGLSILHASGIKRMEKKKRLIVLRRRSARLLGAALLIAIPALSAGSFLPAGWGTRLEAAAPIAANCNGDSRLDISDAIFLLSYLFQGGASPSCASLCDFQQDQRIDVSDAIGILMYSLVGRPTPPPPSIPAEICGDGIDNNCDGAADEDCDTGPGTFSVDLLWDEVTADLNGDPAQVAGYRVYMRSGEGKFDLPVQVVSGCACATLADLLNGISYTVAITAYDGAGNESPLSAELAIQR